MTTSILNDALLIRKEPPEKLKEYLQQINLTIFDKIWESKDPQEAKQTILYILTAYSEDSPLLILRQDSKEEKEGICEYLEIPEYLRTKLMQLSDQDVRHATTKYVFQFAGSLFNSLKRLDIQLEDLNLAITDREYVAMDKSKKDDPKEVTIPLYDWKQHASAVQQYNVLSQRKNALEKQISQQVKRLEGIEDLKNFTRDGKESGKMKGARSGNVERAIV